MQLPQAPSHATHVLVAAFPTCLAADVRRVLAVVPDTGLAPMDSFEVEVQGETVDLPSRICNEEPGADSTRLLTGTQQVILHCLYSRHSAGRVRQHHLEQLMGSREPWVVPFVVQLAGEYVLEILEVIGQGLAGLAVPGSAERRLYGEFITRNPAFFARTERRVVSYWSCYYRWKYPVFGAYPGGALMEAFRAAASEHLGARWPRHTPPPLRVA
ncbi:hypothetical protein OG727_35835 [Streptomyces caniferus]|uniref:Uncharacterized protein n=1 Tax=Streptomyces caniferus TaxID=285557 RepID=A0ABZ1VWP5_9ACTN|nr:hypothetical protein [Streptomyces caniferus]